ncbi:hypothetical protein ANN_06153 [Periplaneta americana]|uniref:Uncharacterized protein n=1 Tax=Periplaneta americana TaxID=6978 RepID=A0ABQ8TED2_PERAM|nr:hypothetical protein ANN_06153 [Periplaneta americana]
MAGLCEGGNEPPGSLKAIIITAKIMTAKMNIELDEAANNLVLDEEVKDRELNEFPGEMPSEDEDSCKEKVHNSDADESQLPS